MEPIPAETNEVSGQIIDAAYHVHKALGPGLLEKTYEACLVHEIGKRGIEVHRQVVLPVLYDGVRVDWGCASI